VLWSGRTLRCEIDCGESYAAMVIVVDPGG